MSHNRQMIGNCPKCNGDHLACGYNHFEKENLTIDAWEHKCADCGFRETKAFRNDQQDANPENVDPTVCPYCGRHPAAS